MSLEEQEVNSSFQQQSQIYNQCQDNQKESYFKKKYKIRKERIDKNKQKRKEKRKKVDESKFKETISISQQKRFIISKSQISEKHTEKKKARYEDTDKANVKRKGRPINNEIEETYEDVSKTYNSLFHHYFRTLLFLKMMKKSQTDYPVLTLSAQQNVWLSVADKLMNTDVFPSLEERNIIFRPPSNSLHFIFQENKHHFQKTFYDKEQLKYILFGFLIQRKLLSKEAQKYIVNNWDIITKKCAARVKQILQEQNTKKYINKDKKYIDGTIETIKIQFTNDQTILASQIANYLAYCCIKYELKIATSQKLF